MQVREGYKQTEVGLIPDDWVATSLGQLTKVKRGASPRPIKDPKWWGGSVGWVRISDVTSSKKFLNKTTDYLSEEGVNKSVQIDEGEVILSICATIGRPIIVNTPACIHDGFVWFDGFKSDVDRQYFYYFLAGKENELASNRQTGTQGNLNTDIVSRLKVPLPPLKEQQKIAEILSTVDTKLDAIDAEIEQTQTLKKGLMQTLLTQGIGHTQFKDSPLGKIPESWEVVNFIDVTDKSDRYSFTGGPFGSDLKGEHYTESGVRVVQLQNIGDGKFINKDFVYTSNEKAEELNNSLIYPDEIIVSKMAEPLARACLIPSFEEKFLMCSDGIRIKTDSSQFSNYFVFSYINNSAFRKEAERRGTGSTRLRIGLGDLKTIPFPKPSIEEQTQIANILSTVDDKIDLLQQRKTETETLKKGLMQKLLTGEVRVKVA